MTQVKDDINSRSGKHLAYEERRKIEAIKNSNTQIVQLHAVIKMNIKKLNEKLHARFKF